METRIALNEREALLIVSALGTYQNRIGQKASWGGRKQVPRLRSFLADTITIGDEQEQKKLRKVIDCTQRRIERYITLGREVSELRLRIKEATGITDEKATSDED